MENDTIFIVAGDEMKKLMNNKFPERIVIPFCEDLSKGEYNGFIIDNDFIENRSSFWNIKKEEYINKMKPIIDIDIDKNYILVFGEDECCQANLNFVINHLKEKGYRNKIDVEIVNEYNLDIIKEYKV